MGFGVFGIEANRFAKFHQCFIHAVIQLKERSTQIVVGLSILGINAQRLAKFGNRSVQLTLFRQLTAECGVSFGFRCQLEQKIFLIDLENRTHLTGDQSFQCILEFRSQAGNLEKTKPTPFRSGWSGRVFFCEILECCARLELHLEARSLLFSVYCDQAQADTLGFSSCRRHGSNGEDQQKKAQNASSDNPPPSPHSA